MLLGNTGGVIGETSALAILLGGLFLDRHWHRQLAHPGGRAALSVGLQQPAVVPRPGRRALTALPTAGRRFAVRRLLHGHRLGDLTRDRPGMWVYGLAIGLIVVFIRAFGGLPEGVMYAILLMNAFTPMINRYTRPRVFGAPA
jgi:Na+-translocating ferredoxin:NAD+ oxidoreductase subunit D